MKGIHILPIMLATALLFGCSTQPHQKKTPDIKSESGLPEWMTNPVVEDSIASVECVPWSNNYSLDKDEATAIARANMVKQIEDKINVMDKTYRRKATTQEGISSGGVFESVSKQVFSRNLEATSLDHVDILNVEEKKHMCVRLVMASEAYDKIFNDLIAGARMEGAQIDPQDERVLYEEFKAYKAQEELERELQGR